MDLSKRCADEIDDRDWQKGTAYFNRGAVRNLKIRDCRLTAEVSGSEQRPYDVLLEWTLRNEGTLMVNCTCPRFEDCGCCKHVAAVILAADEAKIGQRIPGKQPLSIEPAELDDAEE